MTLHRRDALKLGLSAAALTALPRFLVRSAAAADHAAEPLITRPIPSTGERLPVVGIGTARRYDHASAAGKAEIKEMLQVYPSLGGKLIDTAESYGEPLVGELVAELGNRSSLFLATKVGTTGKEAGREQIERSFRRLRTDKIDLFAVHNFVDVDTQLATLNELKQAGRIRYVGVTTSTHRQHAIMEATIKAQKLDFIQVDYAIDNREAADRILPLAQDRGLAVMINVPFGVTRLWGAVQGKPLPDWAAEFDCRSWGQFFLKYIIAHPAVTCAIPGTSSAKHLPDNMGAAHGRLPDAAMRTRMEQYLATL